jgi:hypothetical protein
LNRLRRAALGAFFVVPTRRRAAFVADVRHFFVNDLRRCRQNGWNVEEG